MEEGEEERVEDKTGNNGKEEEDGCDGRWRFLNMPLWSKKRENQRRAERE